MSVTKALVVAIVLHLGFFTLLKMRPNESSGVRSRSSFVRVQVKSATQHSMARHHLLNQNSAAEQEAGGRSIFSGSSVKKTPARPRTRIVSQATSERPIGAISETEWDNHVVEQNEPSDVANSQSKDLPSQTNVVGVFAPCRQLKLPQSWLNTPGLFPRLYHIEFNFPVTSGAEVFNVVALRPEGDAMKYADEVILRSFESCVNGLGMEALRSLKVHFDKHQSVTEGVFSFKIEFQTALGAGSQRKGI